MSPTRLRLVGFIGLCALSATIATAYVIYSARRVGPVSKPLAIPAPADPLPVQRAPEKTVGSDRTPEPPSGASRTGQEAATRRGTAHATEPGRSSREVRDTSATSRETAYLVFRSTTPGSTFGTLAVAPLDALTAPTMTVLRCDRVHIAAGVGVCLNSDPGGFPFPTYRAILFDAEFQPRHALQRSGGVPSRVRVSPDGRYAAITVFVNGHSYAAASFSTRTSVVDLKSRDMLSHDLEEFKIWRDDKPFREVDFNIWGVTFARDNRRFYATLRTAGRTYLIEGDLIAREARVLRENVECPSLSPDNTRLAFKKRAGWVGGPVTWRLSVLDLKTLEDRPLSESRSVDDQAEWLDDGRLLYSLPAGIEAPATTNTWVVPADGLGEPRLFMSSAYSSVVLRK